jgi:adenylylsulfate kinase
LARRLIPEFPEVFVNCPIDVCQRREATRISSCVESDLYGKAEAGRLKRGLPGVSAPYEMPSRPEMELASDVLDSGESAKRIMAYIQSRWLK